MGSSPNPDLTTIDYIRVEIPPSSSGRKDRRYSILFLGKVYNGLLIAG